MKINPEPGSFAKLDASLQDREDLPRNARSRARCGLP